MSGSGKKQIEWSVRSSANVLKIENHIAAENPAAAQKITNEIFRGALKRNGIARQPRPLSMRRYTFLASTMRRQ